MDIKNTRLTVLLIVLGIASVLFATGIPDPQFNPGYDHGAARKTNTFTKSEVDAKLAIIEEALVQGQLAYYFSKTETVVGTRDFVLTPPLVATDAVSFQVTTTTLANYTVPHVTPLGEPGVATINAGEIDYTRWFYSDQAVSTNRSVQYVPELWSVDADGLTNPTFIATGSSCSILGVDPGMCSGHFVLATDTSTGGADRRLLMYHYFRRTGTTGGTAPTITALCGGQYAGIVSLQLPSAVVMRTDGTNADSPVFPGPVTVTGQTTLGNASATSLQASVVMVATSTPRADAELTIDGDTYSTGAIVMKHTGGFSFRTGIDNSSAGGLSSDINNTIMLSCIYSNLLLRGGSGSGINFQANNATKMLLLSTGQLLIATTTAAIDPAVKLKLNGGMEISPGGFAVIGSDTRMAGYALTVASGSALGGVTMLPKCYAATQGVILDSEGNTLLHNFSHPTGATARPSGNNLFLGRAGNFTMGVSASAVVHASENVGIGYLALSTLGNGYFNIGIGRQALEKLVGGEDNIALGAGALMHVINTGNNIALGSDAGAYRSDGTTPNTDTVRGMYLGENTRTKAAGSNHEVVIGHGTIGNGSYSVTIGNTSTVLTVLRSGTCIATNTPMAGYDLTVASGAWFSGPVVSNGLLTANAGASVTAIVALPGTKNAPSYAVMGPTLHNSGMYSTNADGRQTLNLCQGATEILIGYSSYVHFPTNIGANTTGAWSISKSPSTSTAPSYSFAGSTNSGLGLFATKEPCMTASGTEAMRWTATGTMAIVPLLVGTTTQALGYDLTVASATYLGNLAALTPLADPPTANPTPALGMIYCDTDGHLYFFNGSTWLQLDNAP